MPIYQITLKSDTRVAALTTLSRLTPETPFNYDANFDCFVAVVEGVEVRLLPLGKKAPVTK